MKKIIFFASIIICSCSVFGSGQQEISKEYELVGFSSVVNESPANIEISISSKFSVEAEGPADFIDQLKIKTSGGDLIVEYKRGPFEVFTSYGNATVYISLPALEELQNVGPGDVDINSPIENDFVIDNKGSGNVVFTDIIAKNFSASINGSGDFIGNKIVADKAGFGFYGSGGADIKNIDADFLEVNINGSGDFFAEGYASRLDLNIFGSGEFECRRLIIGNASVNLFGSGDIEFSAKDSAPVKISSFGSGDIVIYGDPQILSKSLMGSGDLDIH